MVTISKTLHLSEQNLVVPDTKQERSVIGELDKVFTLVVHDGTITTTPVKSIEFTGVKKMQIYGDHEAEFPREGVKFRKKGERPIESVAVEEYPQKLIVRGDVKPAYRVRNMVIDLGNRMGRGQIDTSILNVLSPTDFSIWAEYISKEESALLKARRDVKLVPGKISLDVARAYFPALGVATLASSLGLLFYALSATVSIASGIIYVPLSLSPNVTLTFPDGRTDRETGAQVAKFDGKIHTHQSNPATIKTQHYEGDEVIGLPAGFSVDGDLSVEGGGRFNFREGSLRVYGGRVSGRLDYNQCRASLVGNIQA